MTDGKPTHRKQVSSRWIPTAPLELLPYRRHIQKGSRVIEPNCNPGESRHELPNYRHFSGNEITTTKYSILTFFFLNIYHQLTTKYATIYFIFIAVLNFCPEFSTVSKWVGLIPSSFVIGTTMLKDAIEDIRRWRSDNEINNRTCYAWDKDRNKFRKTLWKYLIVGDLVQVFNDHDIPADVLLLRSSNKSGTCFVETSNLDGETSLKQCCVPPRYLPLSQNKTPFEPSSFIGILNCEPPVKSIYTVRAHIDYGNGVCDIIYKNNMLLRGSKLKNTAFVEGIVMYAGHDTKVMMNNGRAPLKVSAIERKTNWFIIVCILILVVMIVTSCVLGGLFLKEHEDPNAPFVRSDAPSPVKQGFLGIGNFIICYQVLVPISLYITVEVIKMAQIFFITQDIELYDEKNDFKINCRAFNISEDLGQITHILSDKTGTLTENHMIFRNCALDDEDHSCDPENSTDEIQIISENLLKRVNNYMEDEAVAHFFRSLVVNNTVVVNSGIEIEAMDCENELQSPIEVCENPPPVQHQVSFVIQTPEGDVIEENTKEQEAKPDSFLSFIKEILANARAALKEHLQPRNIFAIGTTDEQEEDESPKEEVKYHAESPDELALVQGAELYGFCLRERTSESVLIQNPDNTLERVSLKLMLPFDSKRKRMSVVVEVGEKLFMYTKGADSAVLSRLADSCEEIRGKLSAHLHEYSCRGLRTLCFAMKELTVEEFTKLNDSFQPIMMDSTGGRDEMLTQLAEEVEVELTLIGVTGIEDKLQDDVDTAITSLRQAGIQVWVLTGDKLETAENIARSSGLFDDETPVYRINKPSDVKPINESKYNIVLSTNALQLVQEGNEMIIKLLKGSTCVLCYRMTPSQKACVVEAVKKYLKGKVLAIGDGANDVPMIQAAHVGIGVKGKEGMQAVMACDFAIGRFRFLRKLLLVHGHWCYDRLSLSFLYFLYKNTNMVFILFFFQFFCGNSGSYFVDPTYGLLYPIIFTSLQPILVGVLDQDKPALLLLNDPILYSPGRSGSLYTFPLFFCNVIDGIWQAAVIFFVPKSSLFESEVSLWTLGFYVATGMLFANCAHLAIEVRCWTSWISLSFAVFLLLHFAFFIVESVALPPGSMKDMPTDIAVSAMGSACFWYCTILIVIVAVLPRFLLRVAEHSKLFSSPPKKPTN